MNDWNHDGRVDGMDFYIMNEIMNDNHTYGGASSGSSSGTGFIICFIIAFVVGVFNELLGAAILLVWILYTLVK